MVSVSSHRDRAAFVFRRVPLPNCLVNDAWWLDESPPIQTAAEQTKSGSCNSTTMFRQEERK